MTRNATNSLFFNPNPIVRQTYWAHLSMFILSAPFNAMVMYAPFLAIKTFNAKEWAPFLSAIIPAAHLLAVFFTRAINRSNKTSWVVWPMIFSNLIFVAFIWVDRQTGWLFALVIILSLLFRAPIISAQSAIFRTNYPPALRSYALSVPMAFQMGANALFAWQGGRMFDKNEDWVIPFFLIAAGLGILGAWSFNRVRVDPAAAAAIPPSSEPERGYFDGIAHQFRGLLRNPAFFRYQLSYMFFGAGSVAVGAILPFYLQEDFGASHEQATGAINVVPMFTIALTLPLWGWILDRSNPLVMRAVTTGVWAITPLMLLYVTTMKGVYGAQLIQGIVWSGSTLIWWLGVNYFARAHEVANLMSLHQTLTGIRGVFAPFMGVWLGHLIGYRASMIFWFALMFIGFLIMVYEVMIERRSGRLRNFSETEAILDQVPEDSQT